VSDRAPEARIARGGEPEGTHLATRIELGVEQEVQRVATVRDADSAHHRRADKVRDLKKTRTGSFIARPR
jgi:hypothetical protein